MSKRTIMPAPKRTMPPARKRRRTCAPPVPELPSCLLLEIAARTDAVTIFRCAATCKPLRREILSEDFVRRVCQGPGAVVPSRILGLLDETFSVVHPHTAATVTLEEKYLAPFISRSGSISAAGLLKKYRHLTSRNGLVVLIRREINWRRKSERRSDLCVYDPMTNSRAFLPFAPDIDRNSYGLDHGCGRPIDQCTLLTAADGIGCSFMLVAADIARNPDCESSARVRVQTVSSSDTDARGGAQWSPVKTTDDHPCPWWCKMAHSYQDAAVVVGGVVHWLMRTPSASRAKLSEDDVDKHILTYDVDAATVGSVDIPKELQRANLPTPSSQLASSPDGKLSFVATDDKCTVSVWVLSSGGSWARHVEVNMMAEWGLLLGLKPWKYHRLELERFGDQRSGAVFLVIDDRFLFALNMVTGATSSRMSLRGEMTGIGIPYEVDLRSRLVTGIGIPYEVDLASRLASMKSF